MEEAELSAIRGVGPKVIELLRSALKHPLSRSAESSKPRCLH